MIPSLQKTLALSLECSTSNGTGLPRILLTLGDEGWRWGWGNVATEASSRVTSNSPGVHGHSSVIPLDEMGQEILVTAVSVCFGCS